MSDDEVLRLADLEELVEGRMRGLLRENLLQEKLSRREYDQLENYRKILRTHIAGAGEGDPMSREILTGFIRESLERKYGPPEEMLKRISPWRKSQSNSVYWDFLELLYSYELLYGRKAMDFLLMEEEIQKELEESPVVGEESLRKLMDRKGFTLTPMDHMEILCRLIYSRVWGLGPVSHLIEMDLDGLSGGVSGEDWLWVFHRGRNVGLSFISLDQAETERICRRLTKGHSLGQFTEARGFLVGDLPGHIRAVVARPGFSESWVFFLRMLGINDRRPLEELISGEGSQQVCRLLDYLMKGSVVTAITGIQGSGKTTLLMSLLGHVPEIYTLRVLELAFELHLRQILPRRNIVTIRETGSVEGQAGLDFLKKTDGNVNVIGEVASARVASWMIDSGQTGTIFTIFTHHARSVDALIGNLRNALLKQGDFSEERMAQQQVVDVVRVDVHLHKDRNGRRYIQRISEICPVEGQIGAYRERILAVYEEGRYQILRGFSPDLHRDMCQWMNLEEKEAFLRDEALWNMEEK